MTTSNIIQTGIYADTLFIPSVAVFQNDSLQFVYLDKKTQIVKKVVDLGDENENYTLIRQGLNEGDVVLMTVPDNEEDLALEGVELYREIKERKAREEEEARKAGQEENKQPVQNNTQPTAGLQSEMISQ